METLKKKKISNKSHQMTLTEIVNVENLDLIVNKLPEILKSGYSLSPNHSNFENNLYFRNALPVLEKYFNNVKIPDIQPSGFPEDLKVGYVDVDYLTPRKRGITRKGRVYPRSSLGLIAMSRPVRNFLVTDSRGNPLTLDFDIENAHPVIWYQYNLKKGIQLPMLNDYILNRPKWKTLYQEVKTQVIVALNGGEPLNIPRGPLNDLITEIQTSIQHYTKMEVYNIVTEIERSIIDRAIEFIEFQTGEPVVVYAYDGFMIRNDPKIWDADYIKFVLKEISEYALINTGYKVKFTNKPIENDPEFLKVLGVSHHVTDRVAEEKPTDPKGDPVGGDDYTHKLQLSPTKKFGEEVKENLFREHLKKGSLVTMSIKLSLGDGKTFKILQDLNQIDGITALVILNRISLIDSIKYDYPFVQVYNDPHSTRIIDGVGKITIICEESLHRLSKTTLQKCDVLVLDEIQSTFSQFQSSSTHGLNITQNQNLFYALTKNSPIVVMSDANLEEDMINFICEIREHPPGKCIRYEGTPFKTREIQFYEGTQGDSLQRYLSKVKDDIINKGMKIFLVATVSINKIEGFCNNIKTEYPDIKVLYINSQTRLKPEESQVIQDSSLWKNYDLFCISPTITSGVSCVVKNHFDKVCCLFTRSTVNAYDSVQMIGRVRYPKSDLVEIFVDNNRNPKFNASVLTRADIKKRLINNQHDLYFNNRVLFDTKFDMTTFREGIEFNHRAKMFIENYFYQTQQYNLFNTKIKQGLQNSFVCKFLKVIDLDEMDQCLLKIDDDQVGSICKDINEVSNRKALEVYTAENITESEYLDLSRKRSELNYNDNLRVTKYKINSTLKYDISDYPEFNSKLLKTVMYEIVPKTKIVRSVYQLGWAPGPCGSYVDNRSSEDIIASSWEPDPEYDKLGNRHDWSWDLPNTDWIKTYAEDLDTRGIDKLFKDIRVTIKYVHDILKFFDPNRLNIFQKMELNHEQITQGVTKFVKYLQEGRYRERDRGSMKLRVAEIFNIQYQHISFQTLKKSTTADIIKLLNEQILPKVGLRIERIGLKRIDKIIKRARITERIADKYVLRLIRPMILTMNLGENHPKLVPIILSDSEPTTPPVESYNNSVFWYETRPLTQA